MITEEQRRQFREEGFFILDRCFDPSEIDTLTERIERFVEEYRGSMRERQNGEEGISRVNEITFTAHLAARDGEIQRFCGNKAFVGLTTDLLGPDVSLYWEQAVFKRPETPRDFPWHQDNGYTPVEPEEYVTCWLALTDATLENGCIWVVPRSHRQGTLEHKNTPIGKQCYFGEDPGVAVPLHKGSMAVFSSLLFHRSGPNLSNTTRKAYVVQFTPANARHGETKEPFNRLVIARDGLPTLT